MTAASRRVLRRRVLRRRVLRRRVLRRGVLLTVPLVIAACVEAPDDPRPDPFTVIDSAGMEIVTSHGPLLDPLDSAAALSISTEPLVRIGVVTGEPAYQFSSITGLTRLTDGRIVVLDEMSRELRFFSSGGQHLSTSGRSGQGPGEFEAPGSLERLGGDTLQVVDFLTRIRFAPDGSFVGQEEVDWGRVKELGDFFLECPGELPHFVGDDIIGCAGSEPVLPGDGIEAHLSGSLSAMLRIPADIDRADTLAHVLGSGFRMVRYRSEVVGLGEAYVPEGILAIGGDPPLFVHASSRVYSVEVRTLEGRLVRILRRPEGNRPPEPVELEPWTTTFNPPAGLTTRQLVRFELTELPQVDSISSLRSLFVDDLNRVWGGIRDSRFEGGGWFDVFDEGGRFLGVIQLPERFTPFEIGGDYVLGVSKDDLDVEFVEMYRLEGGVVGSKASSAR